MPKEPGPEPTARDFARAATRVIDVNIASLGAMIAICAVIAGLLVSAAIAAVASDRIAGTALGSPTAAVQAAVEYSDFDEFQDHDMSYPASVIATWEGLHGGGLRLVASGDDSGSASVSISTLTGRLLPALMLLGSFVLLGGRAIGRLRSALAIAAWAAGIYLTVVIGVSLVPLGSWRVDETKLALTGSPLEVFVGTLATLLLAVLAAVLLAGRRSTPAVRAMRIALRSSLIASAAVLVVLLVAGGVSAVTSNESSSDSADPDTSLGVDILVTAVLLAPDAATSAQAMAFGAPVSAKVDDESDETYGLADIEAETPTAGFWSALIVILGLLAASAAYAGYAAARILPRPATRTLPQGVALATLISAGTWTLLCLATSVASGIHGRIRLDSESLTYGVGVEPLGALLATSLGAVVVCGLGAALGIQSPVLVAGEAPRIESERATVVIPMRLVARTGLMVGLIVAVSLIGVGWSSLRAGDRRDLRASEQSVRADLSGTRESARQHAEVAVATESEITGEADLIRRARRDEKALPPSISALRADRVELARTLDNAAGAAR